MISDKHFHHEVGFDDGLEVRVTHTPTGHCKTGRPRTGENVRAVQLRLVRELLADIYDFKEFVFRIGRFEVDGRVGDFHEIEHLPTKRTKSLDTITRPDIKRPIEDLLDSLVEELWRDGIRPNAE
jgi:hypothetical protein